MKKWIIAVAVLAVLSMGNFAEAKHRHSKGIHGKIVSVGTNTLTLAVGGKKNPHNVTVNFDGTTAITVDGAAGAKIDSTLVGKRASVVAGTTAATPVGGSTTTPAADTITASAIAVTTTKHKKAS